MLVIVSDLHLIDEKVRSSVRTRAFRVFRERLRDIAYDASRRAGDEKTYKPIEEICVVLLGDIFDVIRSSKWPLRTTGPGSTREPDCIRPWDDPDSQLFVSTVKDVTDDILEVNKEALEIMYDLGKNGIKIPSAKDDKPAQEDTVDVTVRTYYMIGNHDWFYHLPGSDYNNIRKTIIASFGLNHPNAEPFPYLPRELDELNSALHEHGVYVLHGDKYDVLNHTGKRNKSSFGDAVVIELLNSFYNIVRNQLGGQLPAGFVNGLQEIDNVRPLGMVPRWVESLVQEYSLNENQESAVKEEWDKLVGKFLKSPYVASFNSKEANKIKRAFKLSRHFSFGKLMWLKRNLSRLIGGERSDIPDWTQALEENTIASGKYRFVVYGHTHTPKIIVLDKRKIKGQRVSQIYLNSGTWRQVHTPVKRSSSQLNFGGYKVMTYVVFFKGDEHRGQRFATWSGNLDSK